MRRVAVYAGSRTVYREMAAAAKSLLRYTRMDRIVFLTEDDEFPVWLPDTVDVINVSGQTWFDPEGPNFGNPLTWMTLIRLALPEILPEEDACLWLDNDTVAEQDISEIFGIDLDGWYLAMVEEPVRSKYPFRYHNAGVMLMNLRALRDGTWKKCVDLVNRIPFTAGEQDAINVVCQAGILTIPPEWNDAGHITQATDDPYIRHFAGCLKSRWKPALEFYDRAEWREWTCP